MYTLFWEFMSGAIAPQIMFAELNVQYEKIAIDMENGEHRSRAYLANNPTGKVPALKLPDGTVIGESAAIVQVLGEHYPESGLVPKPQSPDRASFLFWLTYMAASGYMTIARANHPERHTTDQEATEPVRLAAEDQVETMFETLEGAISGAPYFLPRGYSALDIYLAMLTVWHSDREALFAKCPKIALLYHTVAARDSFRQVMTEHDIQ